jgi:hypothetical protein
VTIGNFFFPCGAVVIYDIMGVLASCSVSRIENRFSDVKFGVIVSV